MKQSSKDKRFILAHRFGDYRLQPMSIAPISVMCVKLAHCIRLIGAFQTHITSQRTKKKEERHNIPLCLPEASPQYPKTFI